MSEKVPAGDVIAAFLERCGVAYAFGVISIHNMPILDAIGRRNHIRFVPSRGEAGAVNMADGCARVTGGIGVAVTSTGVGAGNGTGGMIEAETAGSPVLHLTGQIERDYLDQHRAYVHEAKDQLGMLKAVSKAAYRVHSTDNLLGTLKNAVRTALSPPAGPVSIEIPIDVQEAEMDWPADLEPMPLAVPVPDAEAIDRLAEAFSRARRPLLLLGGGARGAQTEIAQLVAMGIGAATSVHGRGILAEDHPLCLGAFNPLPPVEAFYAGCDAMLVVGSRLRGNETLKYTLKLPEPLYQIDADPAQKNRSYPSALFVVGDSALALAALADRLEGKLDVDLGFAADLAHARAEAEAAIRDGLGPYNGVLDAVLGAMPPKGLWVRDITLSNSTWGNRFPPLSEPGQGIHALSGGIGMGLPMAIGAAMAAEGRKTLALVGDGGLALALGELATAVQERADIVFLVMNDKGYGVIRNIQDYKFAGRRQFADIDAPDFAKLAEAIGLPYWRVGKTVALPKALAEGFAVEGPAMVEIDMIEIGPFARPFAGPPVRKAAE